MGRRDGAEFGWVVKVRLVVEGVGPGGEAGGEVGEEVEWYGYLAFSGDVISAEGEGNGGENVRLGETSIFAVEDGEDKAVEVRAESLVRGEERGETGKVLGLAGTDLVESEETGEVVDISAAGG